MNKELEELKNLVHVLEDRINDSESNPLDINAMLTEIYKIQIRLQSLKEQNKKEVLKQVA